MQDMGNGECVGEVPGKSVTGTLVEFYLVEQDVAGNLSYDATLEGPIRVALVADPALKPY